VRRGGTLQLGNVDAELVSLFEKTFSAVGDVGVEAVGEGCHARAEGVEAEVYGREGVGH